MKESRLYLLRVYSDIKWNKIKYQHQQVFDVLSNKEVINFQPNLMIDLSKESQEPDTNRAWRLWLILWFCEGKFLKSQKLPKWSAWKAKQTLLRIGFWIIKDWWYLHNVYICNCKICYAIWDNWVDPTFSWLTKFQNIITYFGNIITYFGCCFA